MNLKELKSMIAEEYRYWLAEQPAGEPGIEVGPNDVDAMGGGDSEATLKQIFDMLKAYFEGGAGDEAGAAMSTGGADGENMGDMDAAAMGDDDVDMDDEDDAGDDEDDDAEALQERFKKLANIIKG